VSGRVERLDRARVIAVAIELLDKVGLDGLSLRRLATELGVQAPALYWHFKNKQALLDQMLESIMQSEVPVRAPQPGQSWDDWLAERCRDMRRMLNRHRDGAMLAASTHPSERQWPDVECWLSVLVGAGLTAADGLRALFVVGNYVSGFALEEQADRARGHVREPDAEQEWEQAMAELTPYPLIAAAIREVGDPQGDAAFESGLQLIIDGLRKRVADVARPA
jgi:TetR/AcrR family tetracycline transcriptional repressor